jgi:hypothetical protein
VFDKVWDREALSLLPSFLTHNVSKTVQSLNLTKEAAEKDACRVRVCIRLIPNRKFDSRPAYELTENTKIVRLIRLERLQRAEFLKVSRKEIAFFLFDVKRSGRQSSSSVFQVRRRQIYDKQKMNFDHKRP